MSDKVEVHTDDPWQWLHDNGFSWEDVNTAAAIFDAGGWEPTRKAPPTYDDVQAMVAYGDEDDGTLQIEELTDDERLLIVRFRMTLPDVCLRCSEAQHPGLCPPESHMLTDKGELFVVPSR